MTLEHRTELTLTPFEVARRLSSRACPLLFSSEGGTRCFVTCDPVEISTELDPEPTLTLHPGTERPVPRWFGLLPYESFRRSERGLSSDPRAPSALGSPIWRRYAAWVEISGAVSVVGDDPTAVRRLTELLHDTEALPASSEPLLEPLAPVEAPVAHLQRISRALALIAAGDIYEVNLARKLEFRVRGRASEVLEKLSTPNLPRYALALDWPEATVIAASPELCLAYRPDGVVWTSPIKGTRPRAKDPVEDRALALELDRDPKEVAELTMVIDVERNDLGRLALPGSVRLSEPPHVESHPTVHHRVATVEARLAPSVTRTHLLEAMLPSGSVTGAPKVRAMEVIAELEPFRRGLYTGAFGTVRTDGSLELGMAIRTLTVVDGVGEYFSGGGIVADSVPERELEETLWKAAQLLPLVGDSGGC